MLLKQAPGKGIGHHEDPLSPFFLVVVSQGTLESKRSCRDGRAGRCGRWPFQKSGAVAVERGGGVKHIRPLMGTDRTILFLFLTPFDVQMKNGSRRSAVGTDSQKSGAAAAERGGRGSKHVRPFARSVIRPIAGLQGLPKGINFPLVLYGKWHFDPKNVQKHSFVHGLGAAPRSNTGSSGSTRNGTRPAVWTLGSLRAWR